MDFETLRGMIAEILTIEPENIKPETRLKDDLGADSLDLFQLVVELEEKYDVEVPDDELEKIVTVQDALDMAKSLIK